MKKWSAIILLLVVMFYGINNYIWLKQSTSYTLDPDEASGYTEMIRYYEFLRRGDYHSVLSCILPVTHLYAPFYFVPSIIATATLPHSRYPTHIMTNMFFVALAMVAIFLLGQTMYGSGTGILAAVFLAFYPGLFWASRKFYLEVGLLWTIAATPYLLLKSREFSNLPYALLAGTVMGVGLMTKAPYALFAFPVVAYFAVRALLNAESGEREKRVLNIVLMVVACFIIAGYKYCWFEVVPHHLSVFFSETSDHSVWYYIEVLYRWFLSPPFFIVFVFGFFCVLIADKKDKILMLLLMFLPAFLYHSLMFHHKQDRYIVPLLPVIALISARGIQQCRWKRLRYSLITVLIVFGFVNYYLLSFDCSAMISRLGIPLSTGAVKHTACRPSSKHTIATVIVDSLQSCGLTYHDDFTVMVLPYEMNGKLPKELDIEPSVWSALSWGQPWPFDIEMSFVSVHTFKALTWRFRKADAYIYFGERDLKDENEMAAFLDLLVRKEVNWEKENPFFTAAQGNESPQDTMTSAAFSPEVIAHITGQVRQLILDSTYLVKRIDTSFNGVPFTMHIYAHEKRSEEEE